jgi:hypothetical protein
MLNYVYVWLWTTLTWTQISKSIYQLMQAYWHSCKILLLYWILATEMFVLLPEQIEIQLHIPFTLIRDRAVRPINFIKYITYGILVPVRTLHRSIIFVFQCYLNLDYVGIIYLYIYIICTGNASSIWLQQIMLATIAFLLVKYCHWTFWPVFIFVDIFFWLDDIIFFHLNFRGGWSPPVHFWPPGPSSGFPLGRVHSLLFPPRA